MHFTRAGDGEEGTLLSGSKAAIVIMSVVFSHMMYRRVVHLVFLSQFDGGRST